MKTKIYLILICIYLTFTISCKNLNDNQKTNQKNINNNELNDADEDQNQNTDMLIDSSEEDQKSSNNQSNNSEDNGNSLNSITNNNNESDLNDNNSNNKKGSINYTPYSKSIEYSDNFHSGLYSTTMSYKNLNELAKKIYKSVIEIAHLIDDSSYVKIKFNKNNYELKFKNVKNKKEELEHFLVHTFKLSPVLSFPSDIKPINEIKFWLSIKDKSNDDFEVLLSLVNKTNEVINVNDLKVYLEGDISTYKDNIQKPELNAIKYDYLEIFDLDRDYRRVYKNLKRKRVLTSNESNEISSKWVNPEQVFKIKEQLRINLLGKNTADSLKNKLFKIVLEYKGKKYKQNLFFKDFTSPNKVKIKISGYSAEFGSISKRCDIYDILKSLNNIINRFNSYKKTSKFVIEYENRKHEFYFKNKTKTEFITFLSNILKISNKVFQQLN
ncbi:MAG: hypothetical protein GY830_01730 [Bacteroidetes bacterium]|nr:hypothetical protein [Bacteroidota bacterium]